MTRTQPHPALDPSFTWLTYSQLPPHQQEAVRAVFEDYDFRDSRPPEGELYFRTETRPTREFVDLFRSWGWLTGVTDFMELCRKGYYQGGSQISTMTQSKGVAPALADQQTLERIYETERARFKVILDAHRRGEPAWPYVSTFAHTWEELQAPEAENHGDGFHRVVAAAALELPRLDIIYPKHPNPPHW
jgi:hypothetical protein